MQARHFCEKLKSSPLIITGNLRLGSRSSPSFWFATNADIVVFIFLPYLLLIPASSFCTHLLASTATGYRDPAACGPIEAFLAATHFQGCTGRSGFSLPFLRYLQIFLFFLSLTAVQADIFRDRYRTLKRCGTGVAMVFSGSKRPVIGYGGSGKHQVVCTLVM